tara:strand:+ start:292 stop:582 length:291 start_codon:yes stop_codon:yes gene_type:complete
MMPYKNKADRNYRNEYDTYQGKPEQIKNRAERNAARSTMVKKGAVKKGDGMDVDHTVPLSKGGANTVKNLRVRTDNQNRSFSRNPNSSVKKNQPKK